MKKIILIGMKACGKSTLAKELARKLNLESIELDEEIEKLYFFKNSQELTFREIFIKRGSDYFRRLENKALKNIFSKFKNKNFVLSCGGGTPLLPENQQILKKMGKVIFLDTDKKVLLGRILKDGIPAFLPEKDNPEKSLNDLLKVRRPTYKKIADITILIKNEKPSDLATKLFNKL